MTARIEAALNAQLIANANGVDISWTNYPYTPALGTPYMRPTFLSAQPDPWVTGAETNYHTGVYQVDLIYPAGEGSAAVNAQADIIIAAFKQATKLTYSTIDTIIKSSGRGVGKQDGDWYFMPVNIRYECFLPN
jgi:hypothetical protein